ncbi:ArsC/Spx/MgsR family protein [Polluticoccus soli]|uniref:ArsC/Spx/MgsR family protein n=1 Tax=Polluticoccus soli TaxID=3034150 RepID=UPI0023E18688|nr:ArsC/Spx/MgsR family protein [Flavipsychrobacter sp. JY13-12]
MPKVTIYHNGECSKCKETNELLQSRGYDIDYRFYLLEPPTEAELQGVLDKLRMQPSQILRRGEPLFTEKFEGKDLTENEWLKVIVDNPILMQRPIVINGERAIIARPPEKVLDII